MQGVTLGSRADFEAMLRACTARGFVLFWMSAASPSKRSRLPSRA